MQTTTVTVSGKGSNPKTVLYVGGLEEEVTEDVLKAAFIPFGPLKECNVPLDNETGKHRGFGFVQYEEREDAADAVDNMHNAELYGRCGARVVPSVICLCNILSPHAQVHDTDWLL